MTILADPRSNHLIHLALLGTFLLFDFLALAISAAFVHEGKQRYYGESPCEWPPTEVTLMPLAYAKGYYFDASGLIIATSVFGYIAAFAL